MADAPDLGFNFGRFQGDSQGNVNVVCMSEFSAKNRDSFGETDDSIQTLKLSQKP
jgi:hypothetical protein